jgi:hypothetical protein
MSETQTYKVGAMQVSFTLGPLNNMTFEINSFQTKITFALTFGFMATTVKHWI